MEQWFIYARFWVDLFKLGFGQGLGIIVLVSVSLFVFAFFVSGPFS